MPLFKRDSKASKPNSNSNSNSGSPTPSDSPLINAPSAHAGNTLHPITSASSATSIASSNCESDMESHRRSHRSSSVSQKFKNLFLGSSESHSNISTGSNGDSRDSLKRVQSTSSLLKKNIPLRIDTALQNQSLSQQPHSSIEPPTKSLKTPIIHPHVLPIPDRSQGRPQVSSINTHPAHLGSNGGGYASPTVKLKSPAVSVAPPQSKLDSISRLPLESSITNDIDSELDVSDDQVIQRLSYENSTANHSIVHNGSMEHPPNTRIRSSTISAPGFYHAQNPSGSSGSVFEKSDMVTPIEEYTVSKLSNSGSQYNSSSVVSAKDPRRLQGLRHTESVNYSATHLKHQREQTVKLSNRIIITEFGRLHEHDYAKYKTHLNKPVGGLLSWMKKKESDKDESTSTVEKSISLLPDKYSGNLMRVKNNPKNYIWNYDDDDDDEDDDDDYDDDDDDDNDDYDFGEGGSDGRSKAINKANTKPVINRKASLSSIDSSKCSNYAKSTKSMRSVRSRQSKIMNKHYNSDDEYENENDYVKDMEADDASLDSGLGQNGNTGEEDQEGEGDSEENENVNDGDEDDDDDDDDDDFDDEIDNMMIEPIIGKEQVFLINSMLNKIEHPEKFKTRIKEKEREGKIKLTLAQKYGHIEGVIGKGSYGTVSISSKTVNNTKIYFAIKQIKRKQGESLHHFGNRVTSEFMISSSLTHQAVINVYDLMVDPISMTYSEVMEFIPCGDLFSLISVTNGLNIVECDCFFKQILNAITYLHSVGVSHNDLKVENLLLTRKGQLKIIDFGTSAVFRTAWESDVQLSMGACGSERYVAPEQYNKEREYDPRLGDVWSLGIIYLTMYYGKYSWETAKMCDETYARFIDSRATFDYSRKSTTKAHQFYCVKSGTYAPIENIKGGILNSWIQKGGALDSNSRTNDEELVNDSRKYVLYNILNPDPTFRMRTYQIWQSEWIKNFHVCDAGRGYVSYDNYIEMALKSAQDAEMKDRESDKDKLERKESKKGHGFLGFGNKGG